MGDSGRGSEESTRSQLVHVAHLVLLSEMHEEEAETIVVPAIEEQNRDGVCSPSIKRLETGPREKKQFEQLVARYDFEEALWMVDAGEVDPDQRCPGEETLLTKACGAGELGVVKALLQHGAAPDHANQAGRSGLMKAAAGGHDKVVQTLLDTQNVDVFRKDVAGRSALDWARMARHKVCAHLLEEAVNSELGWQRRRLADMARRKKLDANIFAENNRLTDIIRSHIRENNLEEIFSLVVECKQSRHTFDRAVRERQKLLDQSHEPQELQKSNVQNFDTYYLNTTIEGGMTALHRAAAANHLELLSLLLHHGADINLSSLTGGHSALSWAAACGQYDAVQNLIAQGADLEHRTLKERKTPLMYAITNGHSRVAMLIIDHALDLAMRHRDDLLTAVDVQITDMDSVEKYKDWGVFFLDLIMAKDASGRDAAEYAKLMGDTDVQEVLLEAHQRVDARKERLRSEAQAKAPRECKNGCGFRDRADRISRHEYWDCPKRIIQCDRECGAQVSASEMQHHLEHECSRRIVLCCNVYRGCKVKMRQEDIGSHEIHKCEFRSRECRLGCGELLQHRHLAEHENSDCPLRVVQCTTTSTHEGCGSYMEWNKLAAHRAHACPNRYVTCRVGCGLRLRFVERNEHEDNFCKQPCSLGCGIVLGPLDRRQVHECHFCERRIIKCRYDCGTPDIQAQHMAQHEANECFRRPVPCPLGCSEVMEIQHVQAHVMHESGTCPNRVLPCLLDYVGRRVRFDQGRQVGFVLSFDADSGKHTVRPANDGKNHIEGIFGDPAGPLSDVEPMDLAGWTCGTMKACDRLKHIGLECPKRHLQCPNQCGQVMQEEQLDTHLQQGCIRRVVRCSNPGCGTETLHCNLWRHENTECQFQKVKCSCGEWIDKIALPTHATVDCEAAKVRCLLGCGAYIERRKMEDHLEHACPKREVQCQFGCGIERMWAEEQPKHENDECPLRLVDCPQCGLVKVCTFREISTHKVETCSRRPTLCECGETFPLDEISKHQASVCPKRKRWCPLGCRQLVADDEMEIHEVKFCDNRVEDCRQGCGLDVRWSRRRHHEEHECRRRPMVCPNSCGDIVRAEQLESHLQVCHNRKIPCGADSAACTRSLRSWLTSDIERGAARLVVCEEHQESCLSYACGKGELALAQTIISMIENLPREAYDKPMDRAEEARCKRAQLAEILAIESRVGHSPITRAAMHGQLEILHFLTEKGADLNRETSRGHTPLLQAIMHGHVEVVEFLIEHGVSIDEASKNALTPIGLAQRLGNKTLVDKLELASSFRRDLASLFRNIMLCELEPLDNLLALGLPHFPDQKTILHNQCIELDERIRTLETMREELETQQTAALPGFERRSRILQDLLDEFKSLEGRITELEQACTYAETEEMEPLVSAATRALHFVGREDFRELDAITEPTQDMHLVMQLMCTLLNIEPLKERDTIRTSIVINNYWNIGRQQLVRDQNLKRRLLMILNNGRIDAMAVARSKNLIEAIDQGLERNGSSFADMCAMATSLHVPDSQESVKGHQNSKRSQSRQQEQKNLEDDQDNDSDSSGRLKLLDAMNIWAHAAATKHHVVHAVLLPNRKEISALRLALNKLQLKVDEASHQCRFAESKVLAASVPLEDVVSELDEKTKTLKDTRSQLNCVRLLSARSSAGHCALSWAAMYGDVRVVELLLERGAAVEYEDEHRDVAIRLAQIVVKHYLRRKHRPPWSRALASQFRNEDLIFLFQVKKLASKHRHWRQTSRTPLSHAIYNGHYECARLLILRGARIHRESSVFPVGPIPYRFPTPWNHINARFKRGHPTIYAVEELPEEEILRLQLLGHEITELPEERKPVKTTLDVAQAGVKYQGCFSWKHGVGWDKSGANEDTLRFVEREKQKHIEHCEALREQALQKKQREQEIDKMRKLNKSMGEAILVEDFEKIVLLVETGATIDYETPEGHTALTYASWRGTEAVNKDNEQVLAVELLLDLPNKSPNVNRETHIMHTPLSMASKAGRINVMEALLKRGAIPDQVLQDGKTALIHAAAAGKWEACRLLLEHGADLNRQDIYGKTAIERARGSNFVEVVRQLAQVKYGNLGDAVAQRGQANQVVVCGWGCGAKLRVLPKSFFSRTMTRAEIEKEKDSDYVVYHENHLCPKRIVECPYKCGITGMWAEELKEHMTSICPQRPETCPNGCGASDVKACTKQWHVDYCCIKRRIPCLRCNEMVILEKMHVHDKSDCPMRAQTCENGCGAVLPWCKYSEHRRKLCPERLVRCRIPGCGKELVARLRDSHEQLRCSSRIVPCRWKCKEGAKYKDRFAHELKACPRRPVDCPNHCKDFVEAQNLKNHLQSECKRRFVKCELGCRLKVPLADMERHMDTECAERIVWCPNNGCRLSNTFDGPKAGLDDRLRQKHLQYHLEEECDRRLVACGSGCGEKVPLALLDHHKRYSCTKRLVCCRVGCPKMMPFDELETHEKYECRKRIAWCGLGCNATMPAEKLKRHERRECPKRIVLCSLGCGEEIREEDRELHERAECIRRTSAPTPSTGATPTRPFGFSTAASKRK